MNRRTTSPARGSGWDLLAFAVAAALAAAALVLAVISHRDRAADCRARGGQVVVDHDTAYRTRTLANGRKTREAYTTTEHECVVAGQEVDEW